MATDMLFATLALGRRYAFLASQLAKDLARFAPSTQLVVLTDHPHTFEGDRNVIVHRHHQISVKPFHDKLYVIDRAMRHGDFCVFLDADSRVIRPVHIPERGPGVHAFRLRTWAFNLEESHYKPEMVAIQRRLQQRYRLAEGKGCLPYVVECLFSVGRGDHYDEFMQRWAEISTTCQRSRYFLHEGYAIALAARLTSFPLSQASFRGLRFVTAGLSYDVVADVLDEQEFRGIVQEIEQTKHRYASPESASRRRLGMAVRWGRLRMSPLRLPS